MNQEFVARWVAALRSGEYAQTTGRLRDDAGYCCLGVAFDLLAKDGKGSWAGVSKEEGYIPSGYGETYVGLSLDRQDDLAALNDNGATFAELANHIERLAQAANPNLPPLNEYGDEY